MKAVSILAVLLVMFGVARMSWGDEKVVDEYRTVERDGIRYEVTSEVPFTGKIVSYWPNGQKQMEAEYHDGKPHGKGAIWYKNGQREREIEQRDGKPHGKKVTWYENGQKEFDGEYRDGKLHGKATQWHENGQKEFDGEFRDGKLHGKATQWYENGQKEFDGDFSNDVMISGGCWDENENPIPCNQLDPK